MSKQSISLVLAAILALVGLLLGLGGLWLIVLGGSSFYLVQGLAFIAVAALIRARNPLAFWVYAALLSITLVWAMIEAGLDWWQLAPRGDLTVALGIILMLPWVARSLRSPRRDSIQMGRAALAVSLAVSVAIAVTARSTTTYRQPSPPASSAPSISTRASWSGTGTAGNRPKPLPLPPMRNIRKIRRTAGAYQATIPYSV